MWKVTNSATALLKGRQRCGAFGRVTFRGMYSPSLFIWYPVVMNKSKRSQAVSQQVPKSSKSNSKKFGGEASAPVSMSSAQKTKAPRVDQTKGGVRIRHRELIGTVNGSVAFTATKFACNPGLSATFPWLAPQAVQWEQYRFHRLAFEFITRTSTATVGSVLLAPDYDPRDPSPSSEAQVSAYQDAVEDAAWRDQRCVLNVDSMHSLGPRKFVRSAAIGLSDIKTYDAANFFMCTTEEVNTNAVGKLWVDYDVELYVPQIGSSTSSSSLDASLYSQVASQTLASNVGEAVAFDTTVLDNLGIGTPAVGVFTPPAGNYRLDALVTSNIGAGNLLMEMYLELYQDGAALTVPVKSRWVADAGDVTYTNSLNISYALTFDGSQTFEFQVKAKTSDAGAPVIPANGASLMITQF